MLLKEYLIKFGLPIYKSGFMDCDINTDVYDDIINDNVFYGIIRNQRYNWNIQIYDYSQHLKAIEEMKLGLENYFESKIMEYNVLSKS